MVKMYMQETRPSRLAWILGDDQPALPAILDEYPRYKDPQGYRWVCFQHVLKII